MTEPRDQSEFQPTHQVTGPMAIVPVTLPDGSPSQVYVYEGGPVPAGVSDKTIERLTEAGLVTPIGDAPDRPELVPEGQELIKSIIERQPDRAAGLVNERSGGDVERAGGDVERPLPGESKVRWVDYAVSKGMDHEAAMAMTKGELVDRFSAR